MSKHTPGPWKLGANQSHGTKVTAIAAVAWCGTNGSYGKSGNQSIGRDEAYANARLIAAAPLMLEALKDARYCVEHWAGYAGEYFRKKHDIDGDLARIDAAIAAAEGGANA